MLEAIRPSLMRAWTSAGKSGLRRCGRDDDDALTPLPPMLPRRRATPHVPKTREAALRATCLYRRLFNNVENWSIIVSLRRSLSLSLRCRDRGVQISGDSDANADLTRESLLRDNSNECRPDVVSQQSMKWLTVLRC